MVLIPVDVNDYDVKCVRCESLVHAKMGDLFHPPGYQPYVTCAVCSLYEGMEDPVHVETTLAAFPRPDPMHKGRELSPYPYQADDSRLIASVRSILVNAQQGTGKCCSPSTLWNISGGLLEAESVWSQFMSKERFDGEGYWSDPSAPLFVNAINESTGRIERAKVTQLYRQKVKERVRRVKLKDGSQLEITKAHKLYAVDHWTNDYQAGDLVCVPVKLPHESGAFDAELAELFGWVIGDGHEYTKVGALAGVLTQKDRSVLDHCKGLLEKQLMRAGVSDRVIQIRDHDGTGRASDLYFRGKGIRAFFKSHDYPWATLSKDRRVPKPIMQAGPESVRAFLRAYFDAEGSAVEKSRIVEVSSASRRLIQEVSHLLRRFGIWLRVRKKRARATNSRTPTWRDYWIGTIGGTSVRTYRDEIGFGVAEKQGKLERICAKKINPNMEGVPGAQIILDLIQETGLTPSQLGVGVNGMSSAYLRGESRFTRKTLGVVIRSMDAILDRGPDVVRRKYEKATAIMTLKNLDRVAFKAARDQLQKLIDQEVHYVTVESVEEFDYEGWVYDLTVEGHENYVAEGVLTHNTPTLLLSLDPSMGHMITCPAGLTGNWEREGARWRPDLEFEVCRSKGFWDLPSPGKVLIFSYGLLPGDPCKACKKKRKRACLHRDDQLNPLPEIDRPFTLSIDEIQFIQNKTVRRRKWDLLKNAVWEAGGYLRGLTGTSVSNKPGDLKEILQSLNLDRAALGGEGGVDAIHREIWSDWYDNDKGSRSVPVGREKEALLQRLRPVRITRLRRHVLKHLPPVQYREPILVQLTPQILHEVDEAVQRLLATRRAWEDVRSGVIQCPWGRWKNGQKKQHKLSDDEKVRRKGLFDSHVDMYFTTRPWVTDDELRDAVKEALETKNDSPTIGELSKIRAMLSLAKVGTALEIIQQHERRSEPLIVFCQHVQVLQRLVEGREGWGVYTGKITVKARDRLYQEFQKGEVRHGLAVSILTGAEGLNLTRASSMLFIDRFWNPAKNSQCEDRLNRPGAEIHDSITIWRLEADHAVDRLVDLTVREKSMLADAIEDEEWSQRGLVK